MDNRTFEHRVKRLEELTGGLFVSIKREEFRESAVAALGLQPHQKIERLWTVAVGGLARGVGRDVETAFQAAEKQIDEVNGVVKQRHNRRSV